MRKDKTTAARTLLESGWTLEEVCRIFLSEPEVTVTWTCTVPDLRESEKVLPFPWPTIIGGDSSTADDGWTVTY